MTIVTTIALLSMQLAPGPSDSSRVSEVVVFGGSARITRSMDVPCSGRTTVARFARLPPALVADSVRAQVEGGVVEALSLVEQPTGDAYGRALRELEAQALEVERAEEATRGRVARAETASRVAAQYTELATRLLSEEMLGGRGDPRSWRSALDVAHGLRTDALVELAATREQLRKLSEKASLHKQRRAELEAQGRRASVDAQVVVGCPGDTRVVVHLSYLVTGASWEPLYEARVDEQARAVELTTLARVRQSTGEDWDGAKLALSTLAPTQSATPPTLQPLRVYAEQRPAQKKVLVRRDERIEHARTAQQPSTAGASAETAETVKLSVRERATIKGDGAPVLVEVDRHRLKSQFEVRAVPKLQPLAHRVARLQNETGHLLLPGAADIYGRSGFLGRLALERVAEGAPFELAFGLVDGLRIERTVLEESQRTEGLFGGRRRYRYAYRFEFRNHADHPIELKVADHLPVSEAQEIVVSVDEGRTTVGAEVAKEDGVLTWRVKLAAGARQQVAFAFFVDVPSEFE